MQRRVRARITSSAATRSTSSGINPARSTSDNPSISLSASINQSYQPLSASPLSIGFTVGVGLPPIGVTETTTPMSGGDPGGVPAGAQKPPKVMLPPSVPRGPQELLRGRSRSGNHSLFHSGASFQAVSPEPRPYHARNSHLQ